MQEEDVAPSVNLLESMRSVGYSLEAAVADIVDNSISAGARSIQIDLDPVNAEYIAISDDGSGMTPEVAREALRLAGSVGERSLDDLGRFGLGLKTASLSQARRLTVVTTREGRVSALRWDIDHIKRSGRWSLMHLAEDEVAELPWGAPVVAQESGTLVLWQELDLLLGDAEDRAELIRLRVEPLIDNLGLVFHRFLHNRPGGISIAVNGNNVPPRDPFLTSNSRTQRSPTQTISIGGADVSVTAYTLPHVSNLSPDERRRPDLSERMREAQGFYVYRNRRLISYGHWYGLARMDEISKQTRVLVDVPNTIDHLWQLDIKKSRAEPPASFKAELRRVMAGVIDKGKRVYTYRGRKATAGPEQHVWDKVRDRDGVRYEVNLAHPLVAAVLGGMPSREADQVVSLLETVADGFPANDLFAEMAGNTPFVAAERGGSVVEERLRLLRDTAQPRLEVDTVVSMLAHTEPFNSMPDFRTLATRIWQENSTNAH